jgi:hypothetical protein
MRKGLRDRASAAKTEGRDEMSLISPVSYNTPSGASPLQPTLAGNSSGTAADVGGAQVAPAGTSGSTSAMMDFVSEISKLLENLGGDIKNDNMLRMMIALVILMVLLQETQNQQQPASQSLGRGGGADQFMYFEMSSTTISIEQTSITAIGYTGADAYGSGGQVPQDQGGQIDLAI